MTISQHRITIWHDRCRPSVMESFYSKALSEWERDCKARLTYLPGSFQTTERSFYILNTRRFIHITCLPPSIFLAPLIIDQSWYAAVCQFVNLSWLLRYAWNWETCRYVMDWRRMRLAPPPAVVCWGETAFLNVILSAFLLLSVAGIIPLTCTLFFLSLNLSWFCITRHWVSN